MWSLQSHDTEHDDLRLLPCHCHRLPHRHGDDDGSGGGVCGQTGVGHCQWWSSSSARSPPPYSLGERELGGGREQTILEFCPCSLDD